MTLAAGLRAVAAVLVVAFLAVHAVVERCTRWGCYRTFVGRWLARQGGVLADLVHAVELGASVLAALALVGYVVSRLR